MRASQFIAAAAVTAALTGTAAAQNTVSANSAPAAQTAPDLGGATISHWVAAGFIGTSFNTTSDSVVVTNKDAHRFGFGGQAGYLYHGLVGAEFLADFSPSSSTNALSSLLDRNGSVNAYMGNAVGAYPLGSKGQFQPYASGGVGRIAVTADVFATPGTPDSGTDRLREGRFGMNVGGGLMAFATHLGVRTDVRWYRASTNTTPSDTDSSNAQLAQALLSGLEFWRINGGLAVRW